VLAEGFLEYNDDLGEEDLERIHDSSLIYLYRLIFVLYAESEGRDLLPTDNDIYSDSYSLNDLKRTVADDLEDSQDHYLAWKTDLWDRLGELFDLINEGSQSRGIPEDQLYIPAYNGGLFRTNPEPDDSEEALFLASHEAPDSHLAEVVDLLTRREADEGDGKVFVDYSSLDIRHLGSIYEGLLEYQLNVAHEPKAVEDGEYVSADGDSEVVANEGDVYLTTDSGERKATGSYYTPEYIVEYIVEETLNPIVDDIRESLVGQSAFDEGGFAEEFAEEIFNLRILDPAMGSGHFLTSTIDYLAREIIDAQERQAAQQGIETVDEDHDINWARRKVAQRCIYGVDSNPLAVELSKVSLWLRTLAAEQPLAFLDHHLKTGNSLAGSDIEDVLNKSENSTNNGQLTLQQSFTHTRQQALEHVMQRFTDLLSIDNESLDDIKRMEDVYEEIREDDLYQHLLAMANVHTADQFGLGVPSDAYERMAEALRDDSWQSIENQEWFQSAQTVADKERFFHWEIEYPVAFYGTDGKRLEDAGFDAVIGNPPYRSLALGSGQESENEEYLEYLRGKYPEASEYKSNIYPMFIDQGIDLVCTEGYIAYIIPNTILTHTSYTPIRKKILDTTALSSLVKTDISVFEEVETGGITIPILKKGSSGDHRIRIRNLVSPTQFEDAGQINQKIINDIPDRRILTTPEKLDLLQKLPDDRDTLGEVSSFYQGIITGDNKKFLSESKDSEKHEKVVRGRDIHRYLISWGGNYVLFDEEQLWSNANREKFVEAPKILIRQTADRLVTAVDEDGVFSLDSTLLIYPSEYSEKYVSALLNSNVLNWYYQTIVPEQGEAFSQVKIANIKKLPLSGGSKETIQEVEEKYEEMHTYKQKKSELNLSLLDYLGNYSEGDNLPDIGLFQPSSANILNATSEDYQNLRVGEVKTERKQSRVKIYATVRYKPEDQDEFETDQWGYTETDYKEAFTLTDLTSEEAALIEAFVPIAVEEADGFAGFRDNATKTNSPIDRLKAITLPETSDVADDLERYLRTMERAAELREMIENTDQLIDELVYDLYNLSDNEIEVVEGAVE
jgi:type I restriction-modification system DNA methylase subunit